jgi:hypothetical protein
MRKVLPATMIGLLLSAPAGCPLAPPAEPQPLAPADGGIVAADDVELVVHVPDPSGTTREVAFYGRPLEPPGEDFAIVLLPDTQHYAERFPGIFAAQTRWVVEQRESLNIAAVFHLGDIVDNAGATAQWEAAEAALSILDTVPELPYGMSVGNHDQAPDGDPTGTDNFNHYFPVSRYAGTRSWYGGHFGDDNDNHYILFSAGGLDFAAIFLEYDPAADRDVLNWADDVLEQHSDRRAIVVTHFTMVSHLFGNQFSEQGLATYEALKHNPNLFLMLGGHFCEAGYRGDIFNGNTVHSLLADFQCQPNGGDGWLRLLLFSPTENRIVVRTYSPTRDEFLIDCRHDFTLPYVMSGDGPFDELGRVTLVPGDEQARVIWTGREADRHYEWCVSVFAGDATRAGPVWSFQTR